MPITALPPAPSRSELPEVFIPKADALLAALPPFVTQANALAVEAQGSANAAATSAAAGAASQAAALASQQGAAASAAAAQASANVQLWVSGTNYVAGACVWSPLNFQAYRRKAAGAGAADPSADPANWSPLSLGAWWGDPVLLTAANHGQTLAVRTLYQLDSSGGSFTVNLPAAMNAGDWLKFVDVGYVLAANPVTVGRNGHLVRRVAEDLVLDVSGDSVELLKTQAMGVIEQ